MPHMVHFVMADLKRCISIFFPPPPSGPAPPPVAPAPGAAPAGRPVLLLSSVGRRRAEGRELRGEEGEGTEGRRTIPGKQGAAHLRRCGECIAKKKTFSPLSCAL